MPAQWPGESRNPLGEHQDDLLDIIPERLGGDADDVGREDGGKSRSLLIGGLLVGVAVAGAAGFYLLPRDSGTSGTVTPQLVTADPGPYKVRPADPGGMQVPNQDKLVFERSGNGQPVGVENLLPEPQLPAAPPTVPQTVLPQAPRPLPATDMTPPPPPLDDAPEEDTVVEVPAVGDAVPQAVPVPAIAAPQPTAPAPAPVPAPVKAEAPAPAPAQAPAPVAAAAPTPEKAAAPAPQQTAAATGAYMVQFAALRDDASARKLWDDLKGKHADLLAPLSPVIQKADLGSKGIFYRVRATGLSSDKAARALCDELAKRKVGCLFVGQ